VIVGAHVLLWSPDAEPVREFFRDVLGLPVEGSMSEWPLFALGPAEAAMHPTTTREPGFLMYLLCDDFEQTVAEIQSRGGELSRPVSDEGWGMVAWFRLPDGGELPIYEPRHKTALGLRPEGAAAAARLQSDG
jgi:predicted enzyme related to lactoylglutathione lyase